jgi:Na+/H+ antiporter NhaD/arsenite permease-like protein
MVFFVMGMMLALGVVKETGALDQFASFLNKTVGNVWIIGALTGAASAVLDNFATAMSMFSLHNVFVQNETYWKVIAYASAVGGNILTIGSMSGLALAKMERMHMGWYFRNVGCKALVGDALGLLVMYFVIR